jgi:peptide/nickel transport system substrate-binding protein
VYDRTSRGQVCDYLTRTGIDNVTRPWLLEKFKPATTSKPDPHLEEGHQWSNGDELLPSRNVNINRWVDPNVGSSVPA